MAEIWGIDYGSQLAGTTVIATLQNRRVIFFQSLKNKSADSFLLKEFRRQLPSLVFIDAPLSLPLVYRTKNGSDFFYRECDKELKAMSPMFLGGLTARAMKLKAELEPTVQVFETYPKKQAQELNLDLLLYKKDKDYLTKATDLILKKVELKLDRMPENWHQFDALLALLTGINYTKKQAKYIGNKEEGVIWY